MRTRGAGQLRHQKLGRVPSFRSSGASPTPPRRLGPAHVRPRLPSLLPVATRPASPALAGACVRVREAPLAPSLPNARAAHAHRVPAVSVCLNRKADILVPLSPPRPTPQAFASAARPFPSSDRGPSQEFPHLQPHGPCGRLPPRPTPARLPPRLLRATDLALPRRTTALATPAATG